MMSNKKIAFRNIIVSLILQIVTIINGFIVPRIILVYFGSEVNGLISSINQFLNYISLLEGGVGAVIMAALYRPLCENNQQKINGIVNAANQFFKRIAGIYVIYVIILAIIYPLFIDTSFSWGFISSLVLIIAINLFVQYFFSLSYKVLLNADRRGYIVSITQIVFIILNLVLTIVVVLIYPEIHLLKLANSLAYLIQPLFFNVYVNRHYLINKKVKPDNKALQQRWDGFGQNLAYFVTTNTDIVVLTVLSTLVNVSIYSVYNMIIIALKGLVNAISSAVVPSMGNVLASNDTRRSNTTFNQYVLLINIVSTFLFTCATILITPFVQVYTLNINDANYNQPIFGVLIVLANFFGCIRDPYINIANAAGQFKSISKYAYTEAAINIIVSVILVVLNFGLVGVAIGTMLAMTYRFFAQAYYLKLNVLYRPFLKAIKSIVCMGLVVIICNILTIFIPKTTSFTFESWIIYAIPISFLVIFITLIIFGIFFENDLKELVGKRLKG